MNIFYVKRRRYDCGSLRQFICTTLTLKHEHICICIVPPSLASFVRTHEDTCLLVRRMQHSSCRCAGVSVHKYCLRPCTCKTLNPSVCLKEAINPTGFFCSPYVCVGVRTVFLLCLHAQVMQMPVEYVYCEIIILT